MTRRVLPLALLSMALSLAGCATAPPLVQRPPVRPAKIPKAGPLHRKGELLYHVIIGDIAGQQGHLGAAAQAFGKAAQESGDENLTRRSAVLSLYARHYKQAHHLAHLWLTENPQSVSALEALADADLGLGKVILSEQEFERSLDEITIRYGAGGRAFAFEHIVTLLLRHKNPPPALTVMRALSARYPKDPVGDYALADLGRRSGQDATALRAVDRALALKPHWEDAAVLKARILWVAAPRQALAFSVRFLEANPDATRLRLDYARRLVSLQYWHRALAQFQIISEAAPNDPQVLYAAGLLALRTHKLLLAHHYLKRSLTLAPGNAHTELYLGEIAEKERRFARAHYYYSEVPPPYRFPAQLRDALMPLKVSAPRLAWHRLLELSARTPAEAVSLSLARNQVLMVLGDYQKGLAALNAVMGKTQHVSTLLYARALDEEKLGQTASAEADLERLVKAHPHSPVALNALGYTFLRDGQHKKRGLLLVRKALSLDPDNPDILDSVGYAYYREGHPRQAIPYLRRAYALSHEGTIAAHLGAALWAAGDRAQAQQVWHAASIQAPRNAALQSELAKHGAP